MIEKKKEEKRRRVSTSQQFTVNGDADEKPVEK